MDNQPANSIARIRSELLSGADGLAKSARRLIRWRAVLLWMTFLLAALALLLISDMLLRREETGLRVLSLIAWIFVAGWVTRKLLRPAWRFSPTSLQVAKWIECSRPELGEQLSTAVELAALPPSETRFGSIGFRDSALRDWAAKGFDPAWHQHLETSSLWRSSAALAGVALLLVGLAAGWPDELRLAMTRLAMPWAVRQWPRADQLALHHPPTVVAEGSELQLEIVDEKPPLPAQISLHYRLAQSTGSQGLTILPTTQVGDMAVANLPTLEQAIEVRAVGGDDLTMRWHRIDVVKPPQLERFHFTIQPPAYSGLTRMESVGRRIQVLSGSQVGFWGKFSEAVSDVEVQLLPRQSASSVREGERQQASWVAHLSDDGETIEIKSADGSLQAFDDSISWQLLISTRDSLQMLQPERWSIEIVEDALPVVSLQPAELSELSVEARLPLVGRAADDLGLTEIVARLRIESAEEIPPASFPIWQSDKAPGASSPTREMEIHTDWDFSQELPLVAGQRISVWLEARDTLGQLGKSHVQDFQICKPDDLLVSIQNRQNQILGRVRELVDLQRRNEELTARTWELMRQAGAIQLDQVDAVNNIAQVQRAVHKELSGDPESIAHEISTLRELLTLSRLQETELAAELEFLAREVETISSTRLKAATSAADDVAGRAKEVLANDGSLDESLSRSMTASVGAQTDALISLESLMDRLARNESLQQVQRELAQILNQQNAMRRATDQLQLERLSKSDGDDFRAHQAGLSADQQGLARRLDNLVQRARELQSRASEDQQSFKSQIDRATKALVDEQASSKMRRATEEIRDEKLALAAATQQQVSELLGNALRQLGAGSRTQLDSLQNRADSLREAGEALSELASAQAGLAEQMGASDARRRKDDLVREQANLQQQTRGEAARAEQAGDARSSAAIEEAAESQKLAQSATEQSDFASATESARRAADQLEQAAERLTERADKLEQEVAQQQMFQLSAVISQLALQQLPVAEQFQNLSLTDSSSDLENRGAWETEIHRTASRQEAVRQVVRDVRTRTSRLPVFDWTLEQAELAMSRAVASAQRYRVDPDAREAAFEALRLVELAAGATRESSAREPAKDAEAQASTPGDQKPSGRPIPTIVSLRLLRALQQEINDQTQQLESEKNPLRRGQRLNELSTMQQALGKQLEQLLREIASERKTGEAP